MGHDGEPAGHQVDPRVPRVEKSCPIWRDIEVDGGGSGGDGNALRRFDVTAPRGPTPKAGCRFHGGASGGTPDSVLDPFCVSCAAN